MKGIKDMEGTLNLTDANLEEIEACLRISFKHDYNPLGKDYENIYNVVADPFKRDIEQLRAMCLTLLAEVREFKEYKRTNDIVSIKRTEGEFYNNYEMNAMGLTSYSITQVCNMLDEEYGNFLDNLLKVGIIEKLDITVRNQYEGETYYNDIHDFYTVTKEYKDLAITESIWNDFGDYRILTGWTLEGMKFIVDNYYDIKEGKFKKEVEEPIDNITPFPQSTQEQSISKSQYNKLSKAITKAVNRIEEEGVIADYWHGNNKGREKDIRYEIKDVIKEMTGKVKLQDVPKSLFDECMDKVNNLDVEWYLAI